MMRFLLTIITFLVCSCENGDKKREDFPDTHQKKEFESDSRMAKKAADDTVSVKNATDTNR
jgi:hypothetical protein